MKESDHTFRADGDSTKVGFGQGAPGGHETRRVPHIDATEGGLLQVLQQKPDLVRNRSFIIENAVDEFLQLSAQNPTLTAKDYVGRFSCWASSVRSSIYRQIEVEQFIEAQGALRDRSVDLSWPMDGEQIGSFRVIEELGRGALARVYLCQQTDVGGRQVVVKACRTGASEAHTLGQLRHRNVVPIYSVAQDEQFRAAILCMPFLGRSTLFDLVDFAWEHGTPTKGGLIAEAGRIWEQPTDHVIATAGHGPPSSARSYCDGVTYLAMQLADALHHVHSQGIVHGDIKPSNVLLTAEGEPLLVDFNLSGNIALATTARGGTLPYMPPEQLCGIARTTHADLPYDARSDIFSLGVVLFELLGGRLPFSIDRVDEGPADVANRLLKYQKVGCPSLRAVNAAVPISLAQIVEKCLAWAPDCRFGSARELRDALQREVKPFKRFSRRVLAQRRMIGVVCIGLLLVGGAWNAFEASQGPKQQRYYARGLELQRAQDFDGAAHQFEYALNIEPQFRDAKFELGRTKIAQKNIESAEGVFFELTKSGHDPLSEAFVGYCRSLRKQNTLAIPWYVRALGSGCTSGEVHNDLAVAYDLGDRASSVEETFRNIESHLESALAALPDSATVKFNWISYELKRYAYNGHQISPRAIEFSDALVRSRAKTGDVLISAARVYCLSSEVSPARRTEAVRLLRRAFELGNALQLAALINDPIWNPLRTDSEFRVLVDELQMTPRRSDQGASMPRLLEPRNFAEPESD
jgi:serine/threonine protein kinase